jgi:hypothetical protein
MQHPHHCFRSRLLHRHQNPRRRSPHQHKLLTYGARRPRHLLCQRTRNPLRNRRRTASRLRRDAAPRQRRILWQWRLQLERWGAGRRSGSCLRRLRRSAKRRRASKRSLPGCCSRRRWMQRTEATPCKRISAGQRLSRRCTPPCRRWRPVRAERARAPLRRRLPRHRRPRLLPSPPQPLSPASAALRPARRKPQPQRSRPTPPARSTASSTARAHLCPASTSDECRRNRSQPHPPPPPPQGQRQQQQQQQQQQQLRSPARRR